MHTVVSGFSYPGSERDKTLESQRQGWDAAPGRVGVSIHGASGKAYTDRTKKQAYVSVERPGGRPLQCRYDLRGADIGWFSEWSDDGHRVTLRFYDMPDGHFSGEQGWEQLRRQLLVVQFAYDEQKSQFLEVHRE